MKGLVLSGGKGTRLRPITYTSAKQLVPVANKPVLFRVIEALRDANIDEIGIVIGDTGNEVRNAVGDGSRWGVKIEYIPQEAPLGLAHAVKISRPFIGDDKFALFLGDNCIEGGVSSLVSGFATADYNSQIVLKQVANPQQYGVAELRHDGSIERLTEKPRQPRSDLALVGIYMFDQHIWEAVEAIKPSWRGELEITDAIQWLIEHNYHVHAHIHQGWWIDTGKRADMLDANRLILEEITPHVSGFVDRDSQLVGKVTIEKGAQIINSVIRGPAIIGEDTRVVNSYVGPFTSIYHHCTIEESEIEHSIVLENSEIIRLPNRIEDSLIGRNVKLHTSPMKPKAYRLMLGDNSDVGLL
ncbi:glucose-1-phosphate thymidylyltransferase [Herpetosiphon geysericola]|uniref:Glucose-1-phosphate thymidylyltransferase n=1 Tax=Herpetosiphon geysericola TaxID=70996 RepID=A0A0P6XNU6_9CHLR|nr:glucose-1-phosphate thymidylyltransferase [Herpetosiphon geysericola]KPL85320.1 glucose-1-phosphate thymidylyltransferase [Herpetosiphon geysericola]